MTEECTRTLPEQLADILRELAQAREVADQTRSAKAAAWSNVQASYEYGLYTTLGADLEAQVKRVDILESAARDLGMVIYNRTGQKEPVPGVAVKLFTRALYDAAEVIKWCRSNMPALLVLDVKAWERVAKSRALPQDAPVTVVSDPRVELASNLSNYLS